MAFSGGGMAGGAAGGAMLGTSIMPGWGTAIGAGLGGIMGAFGDQEGTEGQRVNQWLQDPRHAWVDPLLEQQAGFYGDELSRIQRGEAPSYWSGLEGALRGQMFPELEESYFGRDGERGGSIMDIRESAGAQMGTGQRAGTAQITKGLKDYSKERNQIENYIAQLRAEGMMNAYNTIPGAINQIEKGPSGQWDSYSIPGTPGSSLGGQLLGLGMQYGSMPSFSGGGTTSGMFGGSPFDASTSYADLTRGSSSTMFGGSQMQLPDPLTMERKGNPYSMTGAIR